MWGCSPTQRMRREFQSSQRHVRIVRRRERLPRQYLGGEVLEARVRRQHDRRADGVTRPRQLTPVRDGRSPARIERVHRADEDRYAGLRGDSCDRIGLGRRHRQRLLAQHRPLTGPARCDHLLGMECVRTADRHDLDRRIIEQRLDRGRVRGANSARHSCGHLRIDIGDMANGERLAEAREGRQVNGLRDRAGAEKSTSDGGLHP